MLLRVGILGLLLLSTYGGTLSHEEKQNCAKGWSIYKGACYMIVPGEHSFSRQGFSWMGGELYCGSIASQNGPNHDGHLASIHSQEQQKFIDGLVRAKFLDGTLGRSRDFRIGMMLNWTGNALQGMGWSDGSPVNYGELSTMNVRDLKQWYRENSWLNDLVSRANVEDYNHERHNCAVIRYGPEIPDPEHAYLPAHRRRQEDEFSLIGFRPEEELTHLERGGRWYRGHCHSTVYASIEEMAPVINANEYFGLVCQSRLRDVNCGGSTETRQEQTTGAMRQEERGNGAVRQKERTKEELRPEERVNEAIRTEQPTEQRIEAIRLKQSENEVLRLKQQLNEAIRLKRINEKLRQKERANEAIRQEERVNEAIRPEERVDEAIRQEEHANEMIRPEERVNETIRQEERVNEAIRMEERVNEAIRPEERVNEAIRPEERVNEAIRPEKRVNEAIRPEERVNEVILPEERVNEAVRPEESTNEKIHLKLRKNVTMSQEQLEKEALRMEQKLMKSFLWEPGHKMICTAHGNGLICLKQRINETNNPEQRVEEVADKDKEDEVIRPERINDGLRQETIRPEQRISMEGQRNTALSERDESVAFEGRTKDSLRLTERTNQDIRQEGHTNEALRQEKRVNPSTGLEQNTENVFENRIEEARAQERRVDVLHTPETRIEQAIDPERRVDEKRIEQTAEHRRIDGRFAEEKRIDEATVPRTSDDALEKRIDMATAQERRVTDEKRNVEQPRIINDAEEKRIEQFEKRVDAAIVQP